MSSINSKLTSEIQAMLNARSAGAHAVDICTHTLLKASRLAGVIRALDSSNHCEEVGQTAEIGCASGGTSRLIALLNQGRKHWAIDTFVGLVDSGEKDLRLKNGDFSGPTLSVVSKRLADLPNVTVIKGFFPECCPAEMDGHGYSFVHIDVDTYESMHNCFKFFESRMLPGGVIAMDDVIGKGTSGGKLFYKEICSIRHRQGTRWNVFEENDPQVIIKF